MTVSNISSEATWLIVTKLYVEPFRVEGTKMCPNGPGHMTNMSVESNKINFKHILLCKQ